MAKPPRRAPPGTPLSTQRFPLAASAAENPDVVNATAAEAAEQDTTAGPLNLTALETPMVRRATRTGGYPSDEEEDETNQTEEQVMGADMDPREFRALIASGANPVEAITQHLPQFLDFLRQVRDIYKNPSAKDERSRALAGLIDNFLRASGLSPSAIPVYNERGKNTQILLIPDTIVENVKNFMASNYSLRPSFQKDNKIILNPVDEVSLRPLRRPDTPLPE